MANLAGIQHIGEKIFNLVPKNNILSNRGVCKSWKQILDNPMLWLKKLNGIGLNEKSRKEYLVLLKKTSKAGFQQERIGYLLLIKYIKVRKHHSDFQFINKRNQPLREFLLGLPLLYFALISKLPDLELIKFIAKSRKDLANFIRCPLLGIKYASGNFYTYISSYPIYETNPLKDAIEGNHEPEVVEILLQTLQVQTIYKLNSTATLALAVEKQNLEVVKLLTRDNTNVHGRGGKYGSIIKAISTGNVEILRHLITKTDTPNCKYQTSDSDEYDRIQYVTPLHAIAHQCTTKSKSTVHNCTEMVKLILSKNIQNINVQEPMTRCTILHIMATTNPGPCQMDNIRLIAPHSDLKLEDYAGKTAIDIAKQNGMNDVVEFLNNLMTTNMDGNGLKRSHDNKNIFPNKKLKIM